MAGSNDDSHGYESNGFAQIKHNDITVQISYVYVSYGSWDARMSGGITMRSPVGSVRTDSPFCNIYDAGQNYYHGCWGFFRR